MFASSFNETREGSPTIMIVCPRSAEPRAPRRRLIDPDEAFAHTAHVKTLGEGAVWLRYGRPLA